MLFSVVFVVCCVGTGTATGWWLVQRRPTGCACVLFNCV